ncbi:MAG: CARDB domain-containing protein [archaeon]
MRTKTGIWKLKVSLVFIAMMMLMLGSADSLALPCGRLCTERSHYLPDEAVIIMANVTADAKIDIIHGNDMYTFMESAGQRISFRPRDEGIYYVQAVNGTSYRILSEINFTVGRPAPDAANPAYVSIAADKAEYLVGDPIILSLGKTYPGHILHVYSDLESYRFLDVPDQAIKFIPRTAGRYVFKLTDAQGVAVGLTSADVIDATDAASERMPRIVSDREDYAVGDNLTLMLRNLENTSYEVRISSAMLSYSYWRTDETEVTFQLTRPGGYSAELLSGGLVLSRADFVVGAGGSADSELHNFNNLSSKLINKGHSLINVSGALIGYVVGADAVASELGPAIAADDPGSAAPDSNVSGFTGLEVVREQASGTGTGKAVPVRLMIWNPQPDAGHVLITEIIPDGWAVHDAPPDATVHENRLLIRLGAMQPNQLITVNYSLRAPATPMRSTFRTSVNYSDGHARYFQLVPYDVEVNTSKAFFDVEIDAFNGDAGLTRILANDTVYPVEFTVRNLGDKSVVEYPTFFTWSYHGDAEIVEIGGGCSAAKIMGNSIQCRWETFYANEVKSFVVELSSSSTDFGFIAQSNVTYDPPAGGEPAEPSLAKAIWNRVVGFLIRVFESVVGPTGMVVRDSRGAAEEIIVEQPGIIIDILGNLTEVNLTDVAGEIASGDKPKAKKDATITNSPPIPRLIDTAPIVGGSCLLDASESYDPENNELTYSFFIDDNSAMTSPVMLCRGRNSSCIWDTANTAATCPEGADCYAAVDVGDGEFTRRSSIQQTVTDNTGPRIISLDTGQAIIGFPEGEVSCTAEDAVDSSLKYSISMQNGQIWDELCRNNPAGICPYSLDEPYPESLRFNCTASDSSGHSDSMLSQFVAVDIPEPEKVWITTLEQHYIRFANIRPPRELKDPIVIQFKDAGNTTVARRVTQQRIKEVANNTYKVEMKFDGKADTLKIKKLVINNLQAKANQTIDLKIDDVPDKEIEDIGAEIGASSGEAGQNVLKAFSVDPSDLNFTNGTLTSVASGKELWKCRDWNFTLQKCFGSWRKVMDISPGEEYDIHLSPEDPAYAETGLASINTRRSIYHPGETAEIVVVVLDTRGHLVPAADVFLNVTGPNGTLYRYSTNGGGVAETERGIYEAEYDKTSLAGNYSMEVAARAPDVNSTMLSYFSVKEYYEFDILRRMPVTTDPWKGPFGSEVRIVTYTNDSHFNFTETLPVNFTVTNPGGAEQTTKGNRRELTWFNLVNNSNVSYSALPPLITPELYEVGPSRVGTPKTIFVEARPWYLAVDPVTNYTAAACYIDDDPVPDSSCTPSDLDSADGINYGTVVTDGTSVYLYAHFVSDITDGSVGISAKLWIVHRNNYNLRVTDEEVAYNGTGSFAQLAPDLSQLGDDVWATDSRIISSITTEAQVEDLWIQYKCVSSSVAGNKLCDVDLMLLEINFTETAAPEVISLDTPGNGDTVLVTPFNFNFTAADSDGVLNNCSLWANFSSSWAKIQTRYSPAESKSLNFTRRPNDGIYKWNVRCFDNSGLSDWYTTNYTVTVAAPPNITGTVSNDGPVAMGAPIEFAGTCSNPGDSFRLLVCNASAIVCDTTTPAAEVVCEGIDGTSEGPTCTLTTGESHKGSHAGDKAVCCDDGDLCDPAPVSVNTWKVESGPSTTVAPSDQGSDAGAPTQAGSDVTFTITADDPNGDDYYILVCPTNATNPGQGDCEFGYSKYCWSSASKSGSGTEAGCSYTTVPVTDSGAYAWYAFACDNATAGDILCSDGANGTGVTGSPFYVNNPPGFTLAYANVSFAKQNDDINITTAGASDLEGDNLRIQCGNKSGTANLCIGLYAAGDQSCVVQFNHSGNLKHSIFCVLNDSFSVSGQYLINITADNLKPRVTKPRINGTDLIVRSTDSIRVNVTASDSGSGVVNVSVYNGTTEYMGRIGASDAWQVITIPSDLGCGMVDSNCTLRFSATDNVSLQNSSVTLQITIDDVNPRVYGVQINDSDAAIRSSDTFRLNVTVTDANAILNVTVANESMVPMADIGNSVWEVITDADTLDCTTIDGNCILTFTAADVAGNVNSTERFSVIIDDVNPRVTDPYVNKSDRIVQGGSVLRINVTVTDASNIASLTVGNDSTVQMTALGSSVWEANATALSMGCSQVNSNCTLRFTATDAVGNVNSTETFVITIDNVNPRVSNPRVNKSVRIFGGSEGIRLNVSVADTNAIQNVTVSNESTVPMTDKGGGAWEVNTTASALGCTATDGNCTFIFTATDAAGNINATVKLQVTVDDLGPAVTGPRINDSDRVVRKADSIRINVTASDENGVSSVTLGNDTVLPMSDLGGDVWDLATTAASLGCTQSDSNCTLRFTATDDLGNTNNTLTFQIIIDDRNPGVAGVDTNDSDNVVRSTDSLNFSVLAADTNGVASVFMNGTPMTQTGDRWWTVQTAAGMGCGEGYCILNFVATDAAGNSNNSVNLNVTVDDSKPAVQINAPMDYYNTSAAQITFNFTVSDNLDSNLSCNITVDGRVNNTAVIDADSGAAETLAVSGFGEGMHRWNATCWDDVPNVNTSETRTFGIDLSAPVVSLVAPFNNTLEDATNTIVFVYNVTDAVTSAANCSLVINKAIDGAADTTVRENVSQNFSRTLGNGQYNWSINCTDLVGRTGSSVTYNVTIAIAADSEPPAITLNSPVNGHYDKDGRINFSYTPFDALSGVVNCSLILNHKLNKSNQTAVIDGAVNNFSLTNLADATYNWTINCTDEQNNEGTAGNGPRNFTVDKTAPAGFSPVSPKNNTVSTNRTPLLDWSDSGDQNFRNYTVQVDNNQDFGSPEYRYKIASSTNSSYRVLSQWGADTVWHWRVIAFDRAVNNYTTGGYIYTTDNTKPKVSLDTPNDYAVDTSGAVIFGYTATDNHLVNCTLWANFTGVWMRNQTNTSPVSGVAATFDPISLNDGNYKWNVRCYDNATNIGWNNTNYTLYVDTTGPTVDPNYPVQGFNTSSGTQMFNFTAADNLGRGLTCNLTIDGKVNVSKIAAASGIPANRTVSGFSEGSHQWNVTCNESSGFTKTSETRDFTVDLTPPAVNISSPKNQTALITPETVDFIFNASDVITSIANCTLVLNGKANTTNQTITGDVNQTIDVYLGGGSYNWSVNCTDMVGRTGASVEFRLIVEPPVYINPRGPSRDYKIDRDSYNSSAPDNTTLVMQLSDGKSGQAVQFRANLTDPAISGNDDILLGSVESNSTGHAAINFSGRDSTGNKLYAGNYTWWAESGSYIVNGTGTVLVYGGLNLSFRFSGELPDLMYGAGQIAHIQEFLKSFGPESDSTLNYSYMAKVNATFHSPNGTNYTVELVDPAIDPDFRPSRYLSDRFNPPGYAAGTEAEVAVTGAGADNQGHGDPVRESFIVRMLKHLLGRLFFPEPGIPDDTVSVKSHYAEPVNATHLNYSVPRVASGRVLSTRPIDYGIVLARESAAALPGESGGRRSEPGPADPGSHNKLKDDPEFDVTVHTKSIADGNLYVEFSHNSGQVQPISVLGDIRYVISHQRSRGYENVSLTVFDYEGQYFEIKVGAGSEIIGFGQPDIRVEGVSLSMKQNFRMGEAIVSELEYIGTAGLQSFTGQPGAEGGSYSSAYEVIRSAVARADGTASRVMPHIEKTEPGRYTITLPGTRDIRPGRYTLFVNLTVDGQEYEVERNFSWGVLALNTHKSIYLPDETAQIGIAVLDDAGHMVCDAEVVLAVTDPLGRSSVLSTANGMVRRSPECQVLGVTMLPDYYANYSVSGTGTYALNLTAFTANGRRSIADQFSVREDVDFDVARHGPTRIYPLVPYTMDIGIRANRDYSGPVYEYVPSGFSIEPQPGLDVSAEGEVKRLTWSAEFVKGGAYSFSYSFDAPDVSPYLFTLGRLQIGAFSEQRDWMIASDALSTWSSSNLQSGTQQLKWNVVTNKYYSYTPLCSGTVKSVKVVVNVTALYNRVAPENSLQLWTSKDGLSDRSLIGSEQTATVGLMSFISTTGGAVSDINCSNLNYVNVKATNLGDGPSSNDDSIDYDYVRMEINYTPPMPPNVSLISPPINGLVNRTPVSFNFTANDPDGSLLNCTLWANFTSAWAPNETIQSPTEGAVLNFSVSPDDGIYLWNVRCNDGSGLSNVSRYNYTVTVRAPADIKTAVTNNGPIFENNNITFSATCTNPGDTFRLLVCNASASFCNTSTPAAEIVCNGSNSASASPVCRFNATPVYAGTHSGDYATCCDAGGLCDPDTETVNAWTIKGAPVVVTGPSDLGSSAASPTQAGELVNFTVTAKDPNNDATYKMLVCMNSVKPAGPSTCSGGDAAKYCQDFASDNTLASCAYSATTGKSGAYNWWIFVCDSEKCSPYHNGSGTAGSPFYVNNEPRMNNITPDVALATFGDMINITTLNAADTEGDALRLQCGNASGVYNLCEGPMGSGERWCNFTLPWVNNAAHSIYCVLNDTFSISLENVTQVSSDNTQPLIRLEDPENDTFDLDGIVQFKYTPLDDNLDSCQLWGSWGGWGLNQTNETPQNNQLNVFAEVEVSEGSYIWNVWCNDSVGQSSFNATNYTIGIDTSPPNIYLQSPAPGATWITVQQVDFKYKANDTAAGIVSCVLIVNGKVNKTDSAVAENSLETITATLNDAAYNWSINCTDENGYTANSSTRTLTVSVTNAAPVVALGEPAEGTYLRTGNATVYYNVADDKGLAGCSLYLDGTYNQSNSTPVSTADTNNFTLTGLRESYHNWTVNCTDKGGLSHVPAALDFYVDFTPPNVSLMTPKNSTVFDASDRVPFRYNVTDNLDLNLKNCSLFIKNGFQAAHASVEQASGQTFTVTLSNQELFWHVQCFDYAGNNGTSMVYNLTVNASLKIWNNSLDLSGKTEGTWNVSSDALVRWFYPVSLNATRKLILDMSPPNITLTSPGNNTNTTNTTIVFVYNVTDAYTNVSNCTLSVNDEIKKVNHSIAMGANNFTLVLANGFYNWSVNCTDQAGNTGNSTPRNLTITHRDLLVNASGIIFSTNNPVEGQLIQINATIYNRGDEGAANNFTVKFSEISNMGAASIGTVLVRGLAAGKSTTASANWTGHPGNFTFRVFADSGYNISESNETNNNASRALNISMYHLYYGAVTVQILLDSKFNLSAYAWPNETDVAGNIFAADADSSISWFSLAALSRNVSNNLTSDDFEELDLRLNTTNMTDSINRTYSRSRAPKASAAFTVYGIQINNTPAVNSTNSSNFLTGILWDYTDANDGEFNGSQDVVFVTEINIDKPGKYGITDYELKVPGSLRAYVQPNDINKIVLYMEVK